jgi:diadenosine tetraphosphate (Ap4A) HIT family hydrolase
MKQCIFCKISKIEKMIFESDNFIFFKDKYPIVKDMHFLLAPKAHIREEKEIDQDLWEEYQEMCRKAYQYVETKCKVKPLTFIHPPQMQTVYHLHRHYIAGVFGREGVKKALIEYSKQVS